MTKNLIDTVKFTIGSKIEILWFDGIYKSRIEDINDDKIYISLPVNDGIYLTLSKSDMVEVVYFYDNEIYKFITRVHGRKFDVVPLIVLTYPEEIFEVQRRNYYRVPCVLDMKIYKLKENIKSLDNFKITDENFSKALMIDISGGGIKFKTRTSLKAGDFVYLKFSLDEAEVNIKGRIVRAVREEDDYYTCGVSFSDVDSKLSEAIIKFIFYKMREQRKKE